MISELTSRTRRNDVNAAFLHSICKCCSIGHRGEYSRYAVISLVRNGQGMVMKLDELQDISAFELEAAAD